MDKINLIQKFWDHELEIIKNDSSLSQDEKHEKMEEIRDKWSPAFQREIRSIEDGLTFGSSMLLLILVSLAIITAIIFLVI